VRDQQGKTRRHWLRPESVVVRWVVVLASVIGGVAAAVPLGQVAAEWWDERTASGQSPTHWSDNYSTPPTGVASLST
jgi:hypothetical protein